MATKLNEINNLDEWKARARRLGLNIKTLSADAEDPATHWYAGDDFWHFDATGGDLLPNNGYFYDYGDESYGQLATRSKKS